MQRIEGYIPQTLFFPSSLVWLLFGGGGCLSDAVVWGAWFCSCNAAWVELAGPTPRGAFFCCWKVRGCEWISYGLCFWHPQERPKPKVNNTIEDDNNSAIRYIHDSYEQSTMACRSSSISTLNYKEIRHTMTSAVFPNIKSSHLALI